MDNKKQKYINHQDHLSQHQLVRYNEGEMSDTEMHQVEKHLLSCDLCTDAVEGTALIVNDKLTPALEDLKERLSYRIGKRRKMDGNPIWRWAAVAAVLLLSSFAIMLILNIVNSPENSIVTQETNKEEIPEPMARKPFRELETDTLLAQDAILAKETSPNREENELKNSFLSHEVNQNQTGIADHHSTTGNKTVVLGLDMYGDGNAPETIAFSDEEKMEEPEVENTRSEDKIAGESLSGRAMGLSIAEAENKEDHRVISGRVFDDSGEPVAGANVILKGSLKGTVSDVNGDYSLIIPKSDTVIEINFIGFVTEEISIDDTTSKLSTTLISDLTTLSEVVVTGYGNKRKKDITGAVRVEKPSISAKPIEGRRKFDKYIQKNLSTEEAEKIGVKGDISVSFLISENGTLNDIKVIDSIGYGLDEKVVQLLTEGPKWQSPSTQNQDALKQAIILKIPIDIKKK